MSWQSDSSRGSQENIRQQRSEQRSATEHPANKKDPDIRLQKHSNPSSNNITINSLADVISKLASECDESAVALCNAARMLQRGAQAEIRNLCKPWGVQLTSKNEDGKYSKRSGDILKSELTSIFIEKAREHFRNTVTEFHIDDALAGTLGSLQAIDNQELILIRVIDHACSSEHSISYRVVAMLRLAL